MQIQLLGIILIKITIYHDYEGLSRVVPASPRRWFRRSGSRPSAWPSLYGCPLWPSQCEAEEHSWATCNI